MAGIRLEWAQFGDFDSFDVIRSDAPMDINALPSPIATNLPTMYYVDTTVVEGATYYYRVVARRDAASKVSGEIKLTASSFYDEHWDKVVALLHFDGDYKNEVLDYNYWIGNAPIVADKPLFTESTLAAKFLGSNYIRYIKNTTDLYLGADDFTLEVWVHPTQAPIGYGGWIYSHDDTGATRGLSLILGTNMRVFGSCFGVLALQSADPIAVNVWTHIAVVRLGATCHIFINGVLSGTAPISGALGRSPAHPTLGVISAGPSDTVFFGYIDELRITKGVARYTANFTPPDAPFPSH